MTLTQTAIITKQFIALTIIASALSLSSFIGYKIWHAHYLSTLPPIEEKADTKFGLLPQINFPQSNVSSSNFTYSIDTTTGNLPKIGIDSGFEKLVKIYFVVKPLATFLSAEKGQTLAEKFGITNSPEILSQTNYLFKDNNKSLTVDLDSGNFTFQKEATLSAQENSDEEALTKNFKNLLNQLGLLKDDLKDGRTKVVLLKNKAQISLWPKGLDKKPIMTSDINRSLIYGEASSSGETLDDYLSLNFTYWPIDITTFATYPLKPAEEALADLKSGKGVIIIEPAKPQVSISSIYLGYFLSKDYSPYLQPIYVFEGSNFVAYTSAISEQYYSQAR